MNISQRADGRTRSFARVLGPLLGIMSFAVLLRADDLTPILSEFSASVVWPWVTGVFVTAAGIAVVTFHRSWRGATAVIVSLLGWAMLAKGILLLTFPAALDSLAQRTLSATAVVPVIYALLMVGSLYVSYMGWRSERPPNDRGASAGKWPKHLTVEDHRP